MKTIYLFFTLIFIIIFTTISDSQIDEIDNYFITQRSSMRSIPSSTLQNWVRIQYKLYQLDSILNFESMEKARAHIKYVTGFAFNTIKLFDIALINQKSITDKQPMSKENLQLYKDLAQTYEDMGDFQSAITIREKIIELSRKEANDYNLNNLALVYLKNQTFEKCIETVNKIEINENTSHTRIFSARSYGYLKKYDEAMSELRKIESLNENAKNMIKEINEIGAEKFWKDDYRERIEIWKPINKIKSDELAVFSNLTTSIYSISSWFNEIYNLNPKMIEGDYSVYGPETMTKGKYCFAILSGVPFFIFKFQSLNDYNLSVKELSQFRDMIHPPSNWDSMMDIKNKIMSTEFDGGIISIIIHTQWQEKLIKQNFPQVQWLIL